MCFINLLKERAGSNLETNRVAPFVRGNTAYLTPLVRYISSISSHHVHLHCILRPLKDPWLGQGSHLEVQPVIHHSCHQPAGHNPPADAAPAQTPRRAMEAASTAAEGVSLFSCSCKGPPILLSFSFWFCGLLFYISTESCVSHMWGQEKFIFLPPSDEIMEIKVCSVCSRNPVS